MQERDTIERYIEAKHGSGGPDADRFADDEDFEVHTSQIHACRLRHYLDRKRDIPTEASPYFELGRIFETLYGAALAWEIGDLPRSALTQNKPWDLPAMVPRVEQDVNIGVDFSSAEITGEADWVVLKQNAESMAKESGGLDKIERNEDGKRAVRWQDGTVQKLADGDSTPVEMVIETKTIKELSMLDGSPKTSAWWQLYGYMYAMGAPGKVSYMVRDDFEHRDFIVERSDGHDMDLELRVRRKVEDLESGDGRPPANPTNRWECFYCDHKNECSDALM